MGSIVGYRAQMRPGYESDRWRLMVMERASGHTTDLTDSLDRWVNSFTWSPDSASLFFTVVDRGRQAIEQISVGGGAARVVASGDNVLDDMQFTRDGKTMVYTQQTGSSPAEIYRVNSTGGAPAAMTHLNDRILGGAQLTPLEEFWADSPDGARVQYFVVKPYGFEAGKKYPVIYADPRRTGRVLGIRLDVPLERAGVRGRRVRGGGAEPARVGGIRAEVHRRGERGLGRQTVRRHHGGDGQRDLVPAIRRRAAADGGGRVLRRLHGGLDAGPHTALQSA